MKEKLSLLKILDDTISIPLTLLVMSVLYISYFFFNVGQSPIGVEMAHLFILFLLSHVIVGVGFILVVLSTGFLKINYDKARIISAISILLLAAVFNGSLMRLVYFGNVEYKSITFRKEAVVIFSKAVEERKKGINDDLTTYKVVDNSVVLYNVLAPITAGEFYTLDLKTRNSGINRIDIRKDLIINYREK